MDNEIKFVKELPDIEREALINEARSKGIMGNLLNFGIDTLKNKINNMEDSNKMATNIENRLLRKKALEEDIQKKQFELAEISQLEAAAKKIKKTITDFNELKVVLDGQKILSTQVFDRYTVYEYLNTKTNQLTPINGKQAESVFGMNDADMEAFGKKELGAMYQGQDFILKFRHFEG